MMKAHAEFLEYDTTGISVLGKSSTEKSALILIRAIAEMSHRSPEFDNILKETEKLLRDQM